MASRLSAWSAGRGCPEFSSAYLPTNLTSPLFPFAVLASLNWRVLAVAIATSGLLGVAAGIEFGYQGWQCFIDLLYHRNSSLSTDGGELALQSAYGLLHWAGASAWLSWTVHLTLAVVVAIAVCLVWAKPIPQSLKASILCIGAVTITPYVLHYDLCILSIAVAFLVKNGLSRGFLPGERTVILIWLASFLLWLAQVPISPVVYVVMLFLITRRIVVYQKKDKGDRKDDAALEENAIVNAS